jgi:hypothetical protein
VRAWLVRWAVLLAAAAVLGACASWSQHSGHTARCKPKKGMTTDQLAACGCVPAGTASGAMVTSEGGGKASPSRVVVIVPYVCPLGKEGIVRVSVINGVVGDIM